MKYLSNKDYAHSDPEKVGILITNLGTPEEPTAKALRKYLGEFLWDPRVVEVPRPIWWLILNLVILRIRPKSSAETYAKIWTPEGSPLLVYTKAQAHALKEMVAEKLNAEACELAFAMRYGQPSIESALLELQKKHVTRLLVLPLYPQYSGSTTGSTFDAVAQAMAKLRWIPELRFVNQYADDAGYIDACVQQISTYWQQHTRSNKLIFSFHGLPKKYLTKGDPYHCQCLKTGRLIAEKLQLQDEQWQVTFQSRFGREEWLKPYTDKTLEHLGKEKKVESVDVFCPGFSSDCVETLEEINMLNREIFLEAGGKSFQYIPALNASSAHIEALFNIATRHMQGWQQVEKGYSPAEHGNEKLLSQERAIKLGAKQ